MIRTIAESRGISNDDKHQSSLEMRGVDTMAKPREGDIQQCKERLGERAREFSQSAPLSLADESRWLYVPVLCAVSNLLSVSHLMLCKLQVLPLIRGLETPLSTMCRLLLNSYPTRWFGRYGPGSLGRSQNARWRPHKRDPGMHSQGFVLLRLMTFFQP